MTGSISGPGNPPSAVRISARGIGAAWMLAVGRRLAKESLQFFAQTVFMKAITIVASIVLARLLGPSALGLWALVTSTSGWIWIIAELGLGAAVTPLVARAGRGGDPLRRELVSVEG